MSREIRRVPPDWEHPVVTAEHVRNCEANHHESYIGHPMPMFDRTWRDAAEEWVRFARDWIEGNRPGFVDEHPEFYPPPTYPWEYEAPPSRCYYREREWTDEEASAFQVYESVSEGTPVSPVLQTEDEVVAWVMTEWGRSEEAARAFVASGWAPSLVIKPGVGMASNAEAFEPEFFGNRPESK